ncbi:hypothetical protein EVAR_60796_1 [Eumeta japonica]|uniref:Uncharacterized protein n=1 Tax=Eumeta variegata TaxID=151549 RepID=A0A4C1YPD0_EUMVA|nr:hypothetical protein EVAR_60796_1 [Eumeta japonica]
MQHRASGLTRFNFQIKSDQTIDQFIVVRIEINAVCSKAPLIQPTVGPKRVRTPVVCAANVCRYVYIYIHGEALQSRYCLTVKTKQLPDTERDNVDTLTRKPDNLATLNVARVPNV